MERLGTVARVAQGLAIVRTDERPSLGREVVDEGLDVVGSVVDVFGPVSEPYVAVSPGEAIHLPTLVGSPLYVR